MFCLLGPNGAGKTTTIEILEGFRPRTGGTPVAHAPVTDAAVLLAWTGAACAVTAWRFRWH